MPLQIIRQDITRMRCDAIVNAANNTLLGGGGVDGAIHRAAGPRLLEECMALHGCETGKAKITTGCDLPCRYIIHTVGPIWQGGQFGERALLASCYRSSLELAAQYGCESVAFPLISAGIFGYPKAEALRVASDTISDFLAEHDMTVYLTVYGRNSYLIGSELYADVKSFIDDNYVEARADADAEQRRRRSLFGTLAGKLGAPQKAKHDALCSEAAEEGPRFGSAPGPGAFAGAAPMPAADAAQMAARPAPCAEPFPSARAPAAADAGEDRSLEAMLDAIDESFSQMLLRKIDERGMTDAQCYKRANIDRKLFSKIRSDAHYRPSKPTALAFAVALELPLEETRELLMKAGYALSHSSRFDIIVEYFIRRRQYDIYRINDTLFSFDQALLGSVG